MENINRVIQLLKKNSQGMTIAELSKSLTLSRSTIAIALAELKGAQKVEVREIGMAKLHAWRGK